MASKKTAKRTRRPTTVNAVTLMPMIFHSVLIFASGGLGSVFDTLEVGLVAADVRVAMIMSVVVLMSGVETIGAVEAVAVTRKGFEVVIGGDNDVEDEEESAETK
jgi:preprotein translocase subunit SecY